MELACDPPNTQLQESVPDLSGAPLCTRKDKVCTNLTSLNIHLVHYFTSLTCPLFLQCLSVLKLILKMGLVILMGLLMFWLATDQADWLGQVHFF